MPAVGADQLHSERPRAAVDSTVVEDLGEIARHAHESGGTGVEVGTLGFLSCGGGEMRRGRQGVIRGSSSKNVMECWWNGRCPNVTGSDPTDKSSRYDGDN